MGSISSELTTFGKAQLTAQVATLTDFTLSYVLAEWCGLWYLCATFLGNVSGGVVNCAMNYRWVFPADGLGKKGVAVRYFLVWAGSLLLNTGGTWLFTELSGRHFIWAKIVVAVLVAVLWNYQLQRRYVFEVRSNK